VLTTQQLVNGYTKRLAPDGVERDVERANGRRQDAATFKILAAIHFLPQGASLPRVSVNEKFAIVLDCPNHRSLATGQAGLAPTVDPVIGGHLDHKLVPKPTKG
jgi:hypothetical protein